MPSFLRWLALMAIAALGLQLFFVARIALMAVAAPESTAFERSEAWRLMMDDPALPANQGDKGAGRSGSNAAAAARSPPHSFRWRQQWVPYDRISEQLKRAVIASEDAGFSQHEGVDWDAIEKAWQKNEQAEQRAATQTPGQTRRAPRIVGGSTITQQLAKNLFLSGERTLLRKGQEFVLSFLLESLLSKQRILEIYLNSVEWGEGVFGAEAAAQHYYRKSAARLTSWEAARLAVMLPRPKFYEKTPASPYLASRAGTIVARMSDATVP